MKIAFFGDSLTEGIPGVPFFPILQDRLPEHELYNYGKGGDTVLSLYRRMKRLKTPASPDISFLWVGTNDVLVDIAPAYPVVKTLINQQWSRSENEFAEYYKAALEFLQERSAKIFTVSPLLIGEDPENDWNRRLGRIGRLISGLSADFDTVEYIDLQALFFPRLTGVDVSDYLPESLARSGLDAIGLRDPEQVDERSAQRGLHFTLDGVHLNSKGAGLVAEVFQEYISRT